MINARKFPLGGKKIEMEEKKTKFANFILFPSRSTIYLASKRVLFFFFFFVYDLRTRKKMNFDFIPFGRRIEF